MITCSIQTGCQEDPILCPLSRVVAGSAVRIKQLSMPPEVSKRLREMGLGEEQKIRLVSREVNVICQVCNARLGISSELADNILVELLDAPQKRREHAR
ncbi:MAG TPA: FeoA family protein [Candidatus Saccharimonadales bacterium]|nr:FeoA family protein [Candidatus Saccharimonadales bacterium]